VYFTEYAFFNLVRLMLRPTNFTGQSPPWEANGLSTDRVLRFLWKPKFPYRDTSIPSLVSIVSQVNLVYTVSHHLFNIQHIPSTPRSSSHSFLQVPWQLYMNFSRATCVNHIILLNVDHPNNTGEEYKLWGFWVCNFLLPAVNLTDFTAKNIILLIGKA
jgi:hypothetical protein